MSSHENVTPISEHMQLVIALTQVNSDHLRGEARVAGAEIELEGALAELHVQGETPERIRQVARLREQFDDARRSLLDAAVERARLEQALHTLNAGPARAHDRGVQ